MSNLTQFIAQLQTFKENNSPLVSNFPKFPELIQCLEKLDQLTGMDSAKNSVISQLKSILVDPECWKLGEFLLHAIISGPPGVGKTQLGKILAQTWMTMGLIRGTPKNPEPIIEMMKDKLMNKIQHDLITDTRTRLRRINTKYLSKREILLGLNSVVKDLTDFKFTELPPLPEIPFTVVTREDFVAGYVGQTAIKTRQLLESNRGKVLFIDEAYALINSDNDSFGFEALTVLNSFMSENPKEIIVIFGGYKDLMDRTIFLAQPGLRSRCSWVFNIEGYTPNELGKIFVGQLAKNSMILDPEIQIEELFTTKKKLFKSYGRDTSRLVFQCLLEYNRCQFDSGESAQTVKKITSAILESALLNFEKNLVVEKVEVEAPPPEFMYL